jgi:hypothetical protein
MVENADKQLAELITQFGPPDGATELFSVPASHRASLDGADLACRHIAEKGTGPGGVLTVYFYTHSGKLLAVCPACDNRFQSTAMSALTRA